MGVVLLCGPFGLEDSSQECWVDAAAETFFAVDLDDRDPVIVAAAEFGVGLSVDIDFARHEPELSKDEFYVVAQVTAAPGVEHDRNSVVGRHERSARKFEE